MNRVRSAGFTIIEVMLFLAVTGALAVGVLASSQVTINEQRYRDTLTGMQSKLQQQYNQTSHVVNSRDDESLDECDDGSVDVRRGASNCVMIGRLVQIGRTEMTMTPLIAKPRIEGAQVNGIPEALEDSDGDNDPSTAEDLFNLYTFHRDDSSIEIYEVPWGAEVTVDDESEIRILVLRSPETGLIHTYSGEGDVSNPVNYTALIGNDGERRLCIPRSGLGNSSDLGIILRANASSSAAVELMTGSDACDG